jgi:8-oxo-dGTP diphosphatase
MRGGKKRPACPACGFVYFQNPSPTVSILIQQGGRFLLGRRMGEPCQGKWALPSGYIEYEDDFIAAAVREAKEETGLDVEVTSILNVVSSFYSPRFHFLGLYLSAVVLGGELDARDDLQDVAWFLLAGPLPEMAYCEDLEAIRLVRLDTARSLAVELRHNHPQKE